MTGKTKKAHGAIHEHDFNTALGAELERCKKRWTGKVHAEQGQLLKKGRADILVFPDGIEPVVVECAYEGTANVDGDAIKRFNNEVKKSGRSILTAFAVKIPKDVRELANAAAVKRWLQNDGRLEYAVYFRNTTPQQGDFEEQDKWERFPEGKENQGYLSGTARDLADLIELAATPQQVIAGAVKQAVNAVNNAANVMEHRISKEVKRKISKAAGQPAGIHAMRVAACVWLNAMILQGRLSEAGVKVEGRTVSPAWGAAVGTSHKDLAAEWNLILAIDYRSVFRPASEAWSAMEHQATSVSADVAEILSQAAKEVCFLRLEVMGDIAAEMFPLLAADRKETAAFYTKPEVAELLASLALRMLHHPPKENDVYKIADFACGTGTLLKSAYRATRRKAEKDGTELSRDMGKFHKEYMERGIYGADIQHIASHLAVSGLAGMSPSSRFDFSNIVCPPVTRGLTGSLELLENWILGNLLERINSADEGKTKFVVKNNEFDLCIMNPPYTRAHGRHKNIDRQHDDEGGIFAIDGLSETDRKKSAKRLKKMGGKVRKDEVNMYSGAAGMSSAFAKLADRKLRDGGVFAFVLPLAAANANTWAGFRDKIMSDYEEVIVINAPESLSADTSFREIMICARKGSSKKRIFSIVNLKRAPQSLMEAHEIAKIISEHKSEGDISLGNENIAHCLRTEEYDMSMWGCLGANNFGLAKIAMGLGRGELRGKKFRVPFRLMGGLPITLGIDFSRIGHVPDSDTRGAFKFTPADKDDEILDASLWNANAKTQKTLIIPPTHSGMVFLDREILAEKVRGEKTNLFISRDLRLTSQSLAACTTEEPTLGGAAWCGLQCDESASKSYCLYFNSIFGLILRWHYANTQQIGRARMNLADLRNFPVPDFTADTVAAKAARKIANEQFGKLAYQVMRPCCFAWQDEVRKKIDAIVMKMLGLKISPDDLQQIRRLWCSELSVHGNKEEAINALSGGN